MDLLKIPVNDVLPGTESGYLREKAGFQTDHPLFRHGLSTFLVPVKMTVPENRLFADLRFFSYNKNRKGTENGLCRKVQMKSSSSYTKS